MHLASIITTATAAISCGLVTVLASHTRAVLNRTKIDKHRYKGPATADLMNYARPVEDGIVVCKDGSLTASWIYRGPDSSSTPFAERNAAVARINQMLATRGRGWMLQTDAARFEAPRYVDEAQCHFTDPITLAMDQERRRLFERRGAVYDGVMVLTLTYTPPRLASRRMLELFIVEEASRARVQDRSQALITEFRAACTTFAEELGRTYRLERLGRRKVETPHGIETHDEQLRWINYCITGLNHPIVLPPEPERVYLDALIGGQDFVGGLKPSIGAQHIRVVAIEGFPSASYPGILDSLSEYPARLRWSTRFIFLDATEAESEFNRYRNKWRQKVVGFLDQVFRTNSSAIDRNALAMVDDVERALAEVKSTQTAFGYYTSEVIVMDEDPSRADELALELFGMINQLGFVARIETVNAIEAYLGSLPAHSAQNIRRPLMSTNNLADLMPSNTIWTGSATAPCPLYPPNSPALMHCVTHGATPFRLNLHVGDLGHTLIFGPPGAGKSLHLALIAAQMRRYPKMTVFAFDKGNSLYALTRAIHATTGGRTGLHMRFGADDAPFECCPLQYLDTRSDRAWAMDWIDTLLALNDVHTTPAQRNEIGNAITSMFDSSSRTLTEFLITTQDDSIRNALLQYTAAGHCGRLLDAESDQLELADFTVFEIEDLMRMNPRYALPVLLYLFRRLERALHGQPAVIILDEAWLMLSHAVFRDKIREWLKVLRKANCVVILATQSLSDVASSGILDVIDEACPTKIFLPNASASETGELYQRLGVNERELQIIATSEKKRHYYYTSSEGRRLYEVAPGPFAKAFIAQSDKDSLKAIRELEDLHGDAWVDVWLRRHNLPTLERAAA